MIVWLKIIEYRYTMGNTGSSFDVSPIE